MLDGGGCLIDFLTPPKVAKLLGVHHSKVITWIRSGRLPAINVVDPPKRPRYRVSKESLDAFLATLTVAPKKLDGRRRPAAQPESFVRYV